MNSLIWSEEQALNFYNNVLQDCSPNTTDFFCVAARKKYMSEEDKSLINLGNTCMMAKTILKEHNEKKFLAKLHQVDSSLDWFTDKDGNYLKRECMVFYMNVNHTNVLKAIKEFKHLIVDWDYDIASLTNFANNYKQEEIGKQLKTIQNNLLKSFQDPRNMTKEWIDIDCDINEEISNDKCKEIRSIFNTKFEKEGIKNSTYIIHTQGGIHILIKLDDISAYNRAIGNKYKNKQLIKEYVITPDSLIETVKDFLEIELKEIKLNQNCAVPLPGTIQHNFNVYMV